MATREPSRVIDEIESAAVSRSHLKVLALSGAGVFMDGYDLFIISVALLQIAPFFNTTSYEFSAVASSAILGAVLGAVTFGNLADRLGRKTLYVVDLLFFVVFGAASSFSQNVWELVLFRFLLGVGIGADYPISASYIAEFVSNRHRGKLTASVFSFQGLGILTAVGVSILLLGTGQDAWRWMLFSGVVPAAIALTLRTRMPETPRWYLSHGQRAKAEEVMSKFFGMRVSESQMKAVTEKASVRELLLSPYSRRVFFTSVSWFLVDVGVYGVGILTPTFIHTYFGANSPPMAAAITTGILYIFAGLGYLSSIVTIDRLGRKPLQALGFFGMSLSLIAASLYFSSLSIGLLLVLLAVFYIFENWGPNTTTWVYPVELFPTRMRGTGHGFAATVGKTGALFATFLLPFVLLTVGTAYMLAIVAVACVAGGLLTVVMGTETKKLSLDDVSEIFKSFHEVFRGISANLNAAAALFSSTLNEGVRNGGAVDSSRLAAEVKQFEHNGDGLTHDAFTKLNKKSLAPIDRQDVVSLLKSLDDTLDLIEASSSRIDLFHVGKVTPEMAEFSDLILQQTEAIKSAIAALKGFRMSDVIREATIMINKLENDADDLLRNVLGGLFENTDRLTAFEVMKLKEVYENLEATTDRAEDVADVLSDLLIKYSL